MSIKPCPANNFSHDFKLLFSRAESAHALGVSLATLKRLLAQKQLPFRRIGGKVMIPKRALEAFARRDHPVIGGPERAKHRSEHAAA